MHIHESQDNTQPNLLARDALTQIKPFLSKMRLWKTTTSSYADKFVSHNLHISFTSVGEKRDDPPLNDQKQVRLNGK